MLQICNHYPVAVWVTIMWYTPNCSDGGDWTKAGWWHVAPNACAVVSGEDLDEINRYWCYYAEGDDGVTWSGPYVRNAPFQAFRWCEWTGSTQSQDVGYRLLDIGDNDDFTLNLVP
jgi:uncharacterized membrane protein